MLSDASICKTRIFLRNFDPSGEVTHMRYFIFRKQNDSIEVSFEPLEKDAPGAIKLIRPKKAGGKTILPLPRFLKIAVAHKNISKIKSPIVNGNFIKLELSNVMNIPERYMLRFKERGCIASGEAPRGRSPRFSGYSMIVPSELLGPDIIQGLRFCLYELKDDMAMFQAITDKDQNADYAFDMNYDPEDKTYRSVRIMRSSGIKALKIFCGKPSNLVFKSFNNNIITMERPNA